MMEHKKLFEAFFDNIGCAAVIIEEDTTISLSNKRFAELSGYSNDEIDGKKGFSEFFPPRYLKKIIRYHEQRRVNPDTVPRVYESKAIDRHGNVKDIIITVDMIPNTKKSIVSVLDISEQKKAVSMLKKSEDNYRILANSITDVLFAFDNKLRYTFWNKASEDFTCIKAKDAIGKSFTQLFPQYKNTELEEFFKSILKTKKTGNYKHQFIQDNKEYYLDIYAYPTKNGITVFARDITNEVLSKMKLLESERRYNELFNNSLDGVYISTPEGRFTYANPALAKMLGYSSQDELLGINIPRDLYFSEQERPNHSSRDRPVVRRLKKKDGSEIWVEIHSRVVRDENGEPIYYQGVTRDITERKKIEDALNESEKKYRKIVECTHEGIWAIDAKQRTTFVNNRMAEILGYSPEEILSKPLHSIINTELFSPNEPAKTMLMLETARHSEKKILKKDGSEIYVNIEASPIVDNEGNHTGVIAFFSDITERKRMEDELKYQANHDILTSVYNRFFFEEQMKLISKERNLNAGIIVLDVDGLKYINDTLGHHQGDRLLIELTSLLTSTFRPSDIIARIGGDEFAILIRQIEEETIKGLVERLKENITDYNKSLKRHQNPISISIGYSVKDSETKTLEQTFKQADEMLFREKIPKRDDVRASILSALKATMLEKDQFTEEHMTRLKEIAIGFGESVGLDQNEMKKLILTTELHDIGKVIIPDHILSKDKVLTQKEFDIIKKHTEAGYRIAMATPEISDIANYILFSHERWDGQGYPNGLKGKKIPLKSRMVFIIDSYDAMTNKRPYREAMSLEAAIFELDKNAGTQFDPFLVKIFINKVLPGIMIIQPES